METAATQISDEVKELNLESYVLELEADGLTVVPPEVTGVSAEFFDRCTDVLLTQFTAMTRGCPISLEAGPEGELSWPERRASALAPKDAPPPTQMLIQQLLQLDRCFRDLFVNPVVDALIDHLVGGHPAMGGKQRRLSSTNSFVKWQGEYGYGPNLGLHCDQGANPLALGQPRTDRQRHLVPDRVHARRRCPGLRPRLTSVERPSGAGCGQGGQARGVPARLGDRLAGLDVARRVPEADTRACG